MGAQTEWSRGLGLCHRAAMAMETQIHFFGPVVPNFSLLRTVYLLPETLRAGRDREST